MASNGMMSQAEIEALMASMNAGQDEKKPEVQPAESVVGPSQAVSADSVETQSDIICADQDVSAVEGPMSSEEIEAFLKAISTPQPEASTVVEVESENPALVLSSDPSRNMTPEEIEAMLSAMNGKEAVPPEPTAPVLEPASDPNKNMTPEEIEAMLSAMNGKEAVPPELAAPVLEPASDPNKNIMTPEEIEAMLSAMNNGEENKPEQPQQQTAEQSVSQNASQDNEPTAAEDAVQESKVTEALPKPSIFAALKEKLGGLIKRKDTGSAEAEKTQAEQEENSKLLQSVSAKLGKNTANKRNVVIAACLLFSLSAGVGLYYVGALPQISFISKGSSVNASVQNKLAKMGIAFTPDEFVKYAGRGNKEAVELFILGNMEVDVYRASDGVTPLMAASSFGRVDIVDLLLEKGANVNAKDKDDQTPLMKAVKYNNVQVVEHLLQAKADVRGRDLNGNTVVSFALEKKDKQIMTMLSKAGARGLEEGLAQLRASVRTKSKNGEKLDDDIAPSIPVEFQIKNGRAGYAQLGRPVETLYANYPEGNIILAAGYADGKNYPLVKVMVPGQNSPSLLLSLSISKRGQQQLIDSIEIHDERFKTPEGITINSTVGDIKRTAVGMGSVKQIGEVLYLVSKDKRTMFELEVEAGTLPAEWLKSGDANLLPDDMKIRCILLM